MYYNIKVWNGMGNAPWQECSAKCRSGAMGNSKYDIGVCFSMANYLEMNREELTAEKAKLNEQYKKLSLIHI